MNEGVEHPEDVLGQPGGKGGLGSEGSEGQEAGGEGGHGGHGGVGGHGGTGVPGAPGAPGIIGPTGPKGARGLTGNLGNALTIGIAAALVALIPSVTGLGCIEQQNNKLEKQQTKLDSQQETIRKQANENSRRIAEIQQAHDAVCAIYRNEKRTVAASQKYLADVKANRRPRIPNISDAEVQQGINRRQTEIDDIEKTGLVC